MRYALIVDGVVTNIIRLHPLNADSFPNAVPADGLPITIGDTYVDGKVYRNCEEVVPPAPSSDEDMLAALEMLEVRLNG